jgi:uncharacterized protein YlaI
MIDYSGWCESCNHFKTILIDTTKNYNTSYENGLKMFLCEECEQKQVIEKRDKKLNQLLKRNWFDIFKR